MENKENSTGNPRRTFLTHVLLTAAGLWLAPGMSWAKKKREAMTVTGPINPRSMGKTLIHEHILVDFIGAERYDPTRWDREDVIQKILPFLEEAKLAGCETFVDCTPAYLGRDTVLLKRIAEITGLNIITNTGYYGGSNTLFLPKQVYSENEDQLANRWVKEWEQGIDGTGIKPGFIKISVNAETLSDVSRKLIKAAARTHLRTGLTIASHTGPYVPAIEQLEILRSEGVMPQAFIWVHAQQEKDWSRHVELARMGAWISLDGLSKDNIKVYGEMLLNMKKAKFLHRALVSHDAGWYDPSDPKTESIRGYSPLYKGLIPYLENLDFSEQEIRRIIQENPQEAFTIQIKDFAMKG